MGQACIPGSVVEVGAAVLVDEGHKGLVDVVPIRDAPGSQAVAEDVVG
jgi:hypothetical protein